MATKLKNLRISKVDFVDEGANPDAHEIWDIVCDCQESSVISVFERPPPGHLVQNWYGIGKILANLQTLSTPFHSIPPHRKTRKERIITTAATRK